MMRRFLLPYFLFIATTNFERHVGTVSAISSSDQFVSSSSSASSGGQYSLGVRDSLMIAHSFHNHPSFGPAGGLHGATYTCDVEFVSTNVNQETNWVIDIGYASDLVSTVLQKYNLKNLDDLFGKGVMTTTEFMAKKIHDDIYEKLLEECSNSDSSFQGCIHVKLWESHKAWATYTSGRNVIDGSTTAED